MKTKKLSFFESMMLVAGAGIGTGLLSIPYAISKIGIFGTLTALACAYIVSIAMYLILADLTRNSKRPEDLLGILNEHLFGGKGKKLLNILFLILLVILLLENLVVYIVCAGDVLTDLLGIHSIWAKIIFYVLATAVALFGVRGLGLGEKISVTAIAAAVVILSVLACFNIQGNISFTFGSPSTVSAVFGLFMFAFSAIFSIIQVCNHIEKPELTGKAIIGGLSLNALITLTFSVVVILGSQTVTEIATIGLSESIGNPFVKILCSVLVLFAMFSSFWSSGFAFADVIGGQIKVHPALAWLTATLPALLLAALLPLTVLEFVQIGAGALSIILVLVVLPAFSHAVKHPKKNLLLGTAAKHPALLWVVAAAMILMAVSSLIPIP